MTTKLPTAMDRFAARKAKQDAYKVDDEFLKAFLNRFQEFSMEVPAVLREINRRCGSVNEGTKLQTLLSVATDKVSEQAQRIEDLNGQVESAQQQLKLFAEAAEREHQQLSKVFDIEPQTADKPLEEILDEKTSMIEKLVSMLHDIQLSHSAISAELDEYKSKEKADAVASALADEAETAIAAALQDEPHDEHDKKELAETGESAAIEEEHTVTE